MKKEKVLDLWCWEWNNSNWIYTNKNHYVIWIDIDKGNINKCRKKYLQHKFILVEPDKQLPFNNDYFNLIQSLDVLEHVDNLEFILDEISRVASNNCEVIIEVPYYKSEEFLLKINKRYWEKLHHVRMFKKWQLEQKFFKRWFVLLRKKRFKFFDNIYLWYMLSKWNIITQKWEFDITSPYLLSVISYAFNKNIVFNKITFKSVILIPLYIFFSPIRWIWDFIFPKSIKFIFRK